jgi:hypothetical protein
MRSELFDRALRLVVGRPPVPVPRTLTERRLADLFSTLASTDDLVVAGEAEDAIWALWTSHDDEDLEQRLDRAIHHIAAREFEPAGRLLDALLHDRDDYVEAWNKRATLYFLMERDRDSVTDIVRTLELEPRHFGAICGFAAWVAIGRVGSISPIAFSDINLASITAVVIGGTSLFGGRGSIVGSVLGAMIVGVFITGLSLAGVHDYWQKFAAGCLVIIAVALDQWLRRATQ